MLATVGACMIPGVFLVLGAVYGSGMMLDVRVVPGCL